MQAPGYRTNPQHQIRQAPEARRVFALVNGEIVAESKGVLRVEEDGHRVRYYFPRADVNMDKLQRTQTTTHCPFKGTAHYFSLSAGGMKLADAVWTYEDPYEEHADLKDRVAFYDDKHPVISVRVDTVAPDTAALDAAPARVGQGRGEQGRGEQGRGEQGRGGGGGQRRGDRPTSGDR